MKIIGLWYHTPWYVLSYWLTELLTQITWWGQEARARVSFFRHFFKPKTWNNPEKYFGTRKSEFRPGTRDYSEIFQGFYTKLGKKFRIRPGIYKHLQIQPGTLKNFRVPTCNLEIFSGSNPEFGNFQRSKLEPGENINLKVCETD